MELLKYSVLLETEKDKRQDLLLEEHKKFKAYAETLTAEERILKEDEIVKVITDFEKEMTEHSYKFPQKVKFKGKTYPKLDVFELIIELLSKVEVEWNQALLVYESVEFFKSNPTEIKYAPFDNITRILGNMKYKGKSVKDILLVNELFTPLYEFYAMDVMYMGYLSMCHNELIPQESVEE